MRETVRSIIKELRHQLEALYGARLVRMVLYGSQARGDAERSSDIDVLVVLQGPVSPGEEIARTSESSHHSHSHTEWSSRGPLYRQTGSNVNKARCA